MLSIPQMKLYVACLLQDVVSTLVLLEFALPINTLPIELIFVGLVCFIKDLECDRLCSLFLGLHLITLHTNQTGDGTQLTFAYYL